MNLEVVNGNSNGFNNNIINIDTIFNINETYNSERNIHNSDPNNGSNMDEFGEFREERNENIDAMRIMIYRFKFTEDFMEELYKFSKIHQYDDRKDFKEAWKVWTEDNETLISEEINRLINLGYDGNILDKMFKSARYYFRKKSTEKKEPKQRRQYISVHRDLLNAMDRHIEENMYNSDYQPKNGFVTFCKDNEKLLKESISKIFEQGIKDSHMIEDKIKKTYKNRYFMLIVNRK